MMFVKMKHLNLVSMALCLSLCAWPSFANSMDAVKWTNQYAELNPTQFVWHLSPVKSSENVAAYLDVLVKRIELLRLEADCHLSPNKKQIVITSPLSSSEMVQKNLNFLTEPLQLKMTISQNDGNEIVSDIQKKHLQDITIKKDGTFIDLKNGSLTDVFKDQNNGSKQTSAYEINQIYEIELNFNSEGTQLFKLFSEKALNQNINFYIDQTKLLSPYVNAPIPNGKALIQGLVYTDMTELYWLLNLPALPGQLERVATTSG